MYLLFIVFALFSVFGFSLLNLIFLFTRPGSSLRRTALWILEPLGIGVGAVWWRLIAGYEWRDWNVPLVTGVKHAPIALTHLPTIITLMLVAALGYVLLRYVSLRRLPPLIVVLSMAAVVIGIVLTVVIMIQLKEVSYLHLYLANCVLIGLRVCNDTVILFARGERRPSRFPFLERILSHAALLPPIALLAAVPLLLLLVAILLLFGQQPDSLIRAWTETADWNFSQKVPPPSIPYEGHYLCTVAATGHRKLVKPLRSGIRHGHTVVVNRQLCVANAFEGLLQERLPRLHRVVRGTYDRIGLPIAKRIRRKGTADLLYLAMKPLEWCFLIVLYLCDTDPENRIAVQYPHRPLPKKTSRESGAPQ